MTSSPFIQRLLSSTTDATIRKALPAVAPEAPAAGGSQAKGYNPFLSGLDTGSAEFKTIYGVNRPLTKPMFLGYKDDKALYGGGRLFILY